MALAQFRWYICGTIPIKLRTPSAFKLVLKDIANSMTSAASKPGIVLEHTCFLQVLNCSDSWLCPNIFRFDGDEKTIWNTLTDKSDMTLNQAIIGHHICWGPHTDKAQEALAESESCHMTGLSRGLIPGFSEFIEFPQCRMQDHLTSRFGMRRASPNHLHQRVVPCCHLACQKKTQ